MVRTRSRSTSRSRSRSRSPRERVDKFGRVIPPGKKRSASRSRSRERFHRRGRSPVHRRHYRSRSRSRSRESRNSGYRGERRSRSSSRQFREKEVTSRTNIEDPAFLNARIFIGKLPSDRCTKEELEELFVSYGKILGVSIHDRGFGFVQFEKEEDARRAQETENGTKFKGQVLDVKMAAEGRRSGGPPRPGPERGAGRGSGPASSRDFDREPGGYPGRDGRGPPPPPGRDRSPVRGDPYEDRFRDPYARREPPPARDSVDRPGPLPAPPRDREDPYYADPYRRPPPIDDPYRDPYREDPYRRDPYRRDPYDDPYRDPYYRDPFLPPPPPKKALPADVQIICMNKQLGQYAESIEARLRQHALIVDITVIPEDLTVPHMVEEAARMKFLFAIIINSQNETHKSLTLNILHGVPQEHRNMPLEDAMKLIATSFEKYIQTQREKAAAPPPAAAPGATPAAGAPPFLPPSSDIAYLLNLLADNRQLTIEELGKVIEYLKERKDKLMINEGVRPPAESPVPQRPAPTGVQAPSASAGDSTSAFLQQQQQELQSKILNILNGSGSSVASSNPQQAVQAQTGYAGVGGAPSRPQQSQSGSNPLINFDNPNVQKALDNLIQSGPNLLKSLPSTVTQSAAPRPSQYQPSNQGARQQAGYPGQQAQQGSQGAQAGYGGSQYGQFQQQSPMQGQAAPRGSQPAGYGAQQQRGQLAGARAPQQVSRPRY